MKERDFDDKENYPDYIETVFEFNITKGQTPERVDVFLARSVANSTRTKVQKAIDQGVVTINGSTVKAGRKIQPGDLVVCKIMKAPPIELIPQDIPLNVVYEDDDLMVINKTAGMCVHPGFGNRSGTLVNALLYKMGVREKVAFDLEDEEEENEGAIFASDSVRPGIVHRIDKDTSGLLVIGKNPYVLAKLSEQFAAKTTEREYNAIVWGVLKEDFGRINENLGRSPRDRKLFAVLKHGGKTAITDYEVIERFAYATLVKFKLHTGRTHQIRVHSSFMKHPIFGDSSYGGNLVVFGGENKKFKKAAEKALLELNRQALHAKTLGFVHPVSGKHLSFSSELPEDMLKVLNTLRMEL